MVDFIKLASTTDLESIVSIYNEYINTTVTMDGEKATVLSRMDWFKAHSESYPILCYFHETKIIGWASLSKWSERIGYAKTVEISVYITQSFHGQGIGKILMQEAIEKAKNLRYHCIIARIDSNNQVSLALHKKFGFIIVGTMHEIGFKFNQYIDVVILQLLLNDY